jgi:hypothetical protein
MVIVRPPTSDEEPRRELRHQKRRRGPCCRHGADLPLFPFRDRAVLARPAIDQPRDFTVSLGPLRRAPFGRGIRFVLRRLRLEEFPVHLPVILLGRLLGSCSAANHGGSEAKHRKQPQRSDELRLSRWTSDFEGFSKAVHNTLQPCMVNFN